MENISKQSPDMTCEALLRTMVTPRRYAKSATACIISSLLVKIMAKSSLVKKITFMKRTPRRRDWNMVTQKVYLAALGCDMPSALEMRTLGGHRTNIQC